MWVPQSGHALLTQVRSMCNWTLPCVSSPVPSILCLSHGFQCSPTFCGACRRKWRLTDTDLCLCGETQTMSHIVESCSLTKLNGGLSRLHSADEDAVSWLTSYGSWNAYEKKKNVSAVQWVLVDSCGCDADECTQSGRVFRAVAVRCLLPLEDKEEDFWWRSFRSLKTTSSTHRGGSVQWEGLRGPARRPRVSDDDDCQRQRLVYGQIRTCI